ncbi:MAG: radical SAM protein [Spirochaetota bacterium]
MPNEPRIHRREVRRALRRSNLSGTFVVGRYALAPYMACGHGCSYCDGRAERYWVDGEFDRDIVARRNLPDKLALELPSLREPGFVTLGSGITDAYQPVERRELLTRRCAEILAEYDYPVTIMTKSSLALRDIDLWKQINAKSRFTCIVSLVHTDDATRARFEPGASTVSERLEMLGAFREAGCATGVLAMPLLPGVTDDPGTVGSLYDTLSRTGVDFVVPGGLTLRPGRQKEFFMEALGETYPELVPAYVELYREERASGVAVKEYTEELNARLMAENRRTRLPFLVPHRLYTGLLAAYDEASVLLQHMVALYEAVGVDARRLRAATGRYLRHLQARKRDYNRHASWDYRELSEELLAPTILESILENARLARFLRDVLTGGATFDYVDLELRPADQTRPTASTPRSVS